MTTYTPEELNKHIKDIVSKNLKIIKVSGEIANSKHSNGNLYASLKDVNSSISIIAWNYERNDIQVKDGDKVIVTAKINFYIKNGAYNLIVDDLEHIGTGDLHQQIHNLKIQCEKNGYFNRKKPTPQVINNIGIVTAKDGAALQDILYVLKKNNFIGKVYIKQCTMQGKNCPDSVVEGIRYFENMNIDALIIARGGGSLEDLIGFSDKKVVEAIYNSSKYTISAIGHEIDFMLSDFTADYRAPTPSISAEYVSQFQKQIHSNIINSKLLLDNLKTLIDHKINIFMQKLNNCQNSLINPSQEIDNKIAYLGNAKQNLLTMINKKIELTTNKLNYLEHKLNNYDFNTILEAGYALVLTRGIIIDSINKLENKFKIKFKDGEVTVTASKIEKIDNLST